MPLLGREGWEIKFCLKCGYAIEKSAITEKITHCPVCNKKGVESKLVDRFVVHYPENKVIAPLAERSSKNAAREG